MAAVHNVKFRNLAMEDYKEIINLWKRAGLPYKPKGRDNKEAMKNQNENGVQPLLRRHS